ncbi:MAG: DUF4282 domain-containing protein [Actinomycetota bacterium]|jgi:hypothetical protein|nr:DUF4282 domain-containing protein [Acidothermales bacterium]MDQ3432975.1 DUF4282 domain-containing protein [Actinomycetota bacterium]
MSRTPDTQEAKSFFTGLFDFSFSTFITMKFLRIIYIVVMGVILLAGVLFLISFLFRGGALGVLIGLVFVPLVTLLYLVLARIYLELVALLFRIGDNTAAIATALQAGGSPGGGTPLPSSGSAGLTGDPPRVQ